jgi:hypothetical protein
MQITATRATDPAARGQELYRGSFGGRAVPRSGVLSCTDSGAGNWDDRDATRKTELMASTAMEVPLMKRTGIGSTALMLLLFGATYSFAQDKPAQHAEESKAPQKEQPAKTAQPVQREQKAEPAQHAAKAPAAQHTEKAQPAETARPAERTAKTEQAKPATQHAQTTTRTAPATRTSASTRTTSTTRTQKTQNVQRSQQAHNFGGHGGGHITDARFSANFGREHSFHMNRPTMYQGYSRFNYGGYYFGFYDPWPSGWGYSDDVYVDYIDGQYFLIDPEHPGPRLMINVVI